jgi:IS5 family transposase
MRMRRAIDWEAIERRLEGYYNRFEGRPGWPPAVLLRMLILEQFADLSDREVHEQVGYNLLYRAFVGLGAEEAVPDDTTLVRFRTRIGEPGMREVFAELNRQWEAAGLVGRQRRVLDGVHLWAKVARRSWVELMRRGRRLVVEAAAEKVEPERAERLWEEFVAGAAEVESRGEQALAVEREKTLKLLEAVADIEGERVRERAEILGAMLAEGDRPVRFEDPDARWGHKGQDKAFLGYKAHEALDPESGLVTAVEVVAGNANEAVRTDKLLAGETTVLEPGAAIIADGLYNNATTVTQVQQAGYRPCFSGLEAERVSDAFEYEAATDQMICPEGKRSIGKVRVGQGDLYYFSMSDCDRCPRRNQCLTPGERTGTALPRRRVYLSDVRKRKLTEGRVGRSWRRENLRLRARIEAKFDEQVNRHGLRHARYWGRAKVTVQVLLNVITVNAKRAVKLLGRAVPAPEARIVEATA